MREQLRARLEQLQKEYELGQARLRELQAEQARITETLLRIDGALLVLKELLSEQQPEAADGVHAGEGQPGFAHEDAAVPAR